MIGSIFFLLINIFDPINCDDITKLEIIYVPCLGNYEMVINSENIKEVGGGGGSNDRRAGGVLLARAGLEQARVPSQLSVAAQVWVMPRRLLRCVHCVRLPECLH